MTIAELKERYYHARAKHNMLKEKYECSLAVAKNGFENGDWDNARDWLEHAKKVLTECADMREEMDRCKRELDSRKAVY